MSSSTINLTDCPNCGAPLGGAFCAACGQKQGPINPTARDVLHDLLHEITHVDGKLAQSVRLLLTKPGFLTREYFAGRRARYVSPIRLYLVFSLIYFAVAAFNPQPGVHVNTKPGATDTTADRQQTEALAEELQTAANEALIHWAPRAMFVLVPVFAGLVALAARRSGRHYPHHLYFALHVHAVWFAAGAVGALGDIASIPYVSSAVSMAATLYGVAYFVTAFRRVYDLPPVAAVLRAAAVGGTYSIVVLATLLAIVLPIILPAVQRK